MSAKIRKSITKLFGQLITAWIID